MKRFTVRAAAGVVVLSMSGCAVAGDYHNTRDYGASYDYAEVISSKPIYDVVRVPVQEKACWDEEVTHRTYQSSATGAIAGGIIGGVVGHQFGKGRGKDAATIAGVLLGGSIGHDMSRKEPQVHRATERRCEVRTEYQDEERLRGYRVTYRYNGHTYTTRTSRDPGQSLRVKVSVEPAE